MVREPEAVEALLLATWQSVIGAARAQLADCQAIADREQAEAGRAAFQLAPRDRQFYAERLRRERFGLDGEAVRAHLSLDAVLAAMFWAAGRMHGLTFERLADAPVVDPSCRVYQVSRGGEAIGVLYLDLVNRPGKAHGSYQVEYRTRANFRGRVPPISSINSNLPAPRRRRPRAIRAGNLVCIVRQDDDTLVRMTPSNRLQDFEAVALPHEYVDHLDSPCVCVPLQGGDAFGGHSGGSDDSKPASSTNGTQKRQLPRRSTRKSAPPRK